MTALQWPYLVGAVFFAGVAGFLCVIQRAETRTGKPFWSASRTGYSRELRETLFFGGLRLRWFRIALFALLAVLYLLLFFGIVG